MNSVLLQRRHRQAAKCLATAQMTMIETHRTQLFSFHRKLARRIPGLLTLLLPLNVCTERPRAVITTLKNRVIFSPSPWLPGACAKSLNFPKGSPAFVSGSLKSLQPVWFYSRNVSVSLPGESGPPACSKNLADGQRELVKPQSLCGWLQWDWEAINDAGVPTGSSAFHHKGWAFHSTLPLLTCFAASLILAMYLLCFSPTLSYHWKSIISRSAFQSAWELLPSILSLTGCSLWNQIGIACTKTHFSVSPLIFSIN